MIFLRFNFHWTLMIYSKNLDGTGRTQGLHILTKKHIKTSSIIITFFFSVFYIIDLIAFSFLKSIFTLHYLINEISVYNENKGSC
jgi:hypothetical protein